MPLTLTVENAEDLSRGSKTRVQVAEQGKLDIGRKAGVDWTLADPRRFISGKHCEIRYRSGTFWLYDVSTNGTFINGNLRRNGAAHALRSGDRIAIGRFIVAVEIEEDRTAVKPALGGERRAGPLRRQLAAAFHLEQIMC